MAAQREIAELIISIEAQTAELKKQVGGVSKTLTGFGKKHDSMFKGLKQNWLLWTAAIAGAAFALKRFTAPFVGFTHKMIEVNTLTNLSTKGFKELSKTVLDMTRRVPQSARELADALYDIVSAGVDVAAANDVLEQSAKAAVAGVTDTRTAARTGLAVINAYGLGIGKLSEVYAILFQTVRKGVITFEGIATSIGQVLPSAVSADVSFKAIAASLATMTKNAVSANRATTAMRSGLSALAAPTPEVEKEMKKLGITWKGWIPTLRDIAKLGLDLKGMKSLVPDERSSKAILVLTQNIETLEETLRDMDDAAGSMQTAYNIMKDSPTNQVKQLANAWDALTIAISAAIAPAVLGGIRALTGALQEVSLALQGYTPQQVELVRATEKIISSTGKYEDKLKALKKIKKEVNDQYREEFKRIEELKKSDPNYYSRQAGMLKFYHKNLLLVDGAIKSLHKTHLAGLKKLKAETPDDEKSPIAALVGDPKPVIEDLIVFNEKVKTVLTDVSNAYKDGEISVKDYYDLKRELVETVLWTEISALKNLLVQTEGEAQKEEIVNKIIAKQIQLKREITNLDREEAEALKALNTSREDSLKLLDEIEKRGSLIGQDDYTQRLAALKAQQDIERKQLIAGLTDEVEQVKAIKQAQYTWEKEQAQLLADFEKEKREEVLNSMAENFGRIADLFNTFYSQRLQTINNTEQAITNAEAAGDTAKVARLKAQQESQKASARKQFNIAKAAAAAEAAINGALAISKAYAQEGIWGALGAITIAAAVGAEIANILGQSPGFEEGGEINGRSGIDKVNIRATKGEFMQPVSAVDHYGSGVMEAIRNKAIPKSLLLGYKGMSPHIPSSGGYQTGGLVDAGAGDGREIGLQINNIVDPDLMGQYLISRPGQKVILNVIGQNAFSIKRKLQV